MIENDCKFQLLYLIYDIKAKYMKTRLSLTIDKKIIASAKKYANQNGISLSSLVENYLKELEQ